MFILILTAFLAGVATIFSPCILPVLPLVLSSGITGGKKRPLGVLLGFVLSFTFFALSLTLLVKAFGVDANLLRNVAIVVLLVFGLTLLVPKLSEWWERLTSGIASKGASAGQNGEGFWGGFVIGVTLGLVWTPCAGPIMASILALAATQSVTAVSIFITLAYSVGATLPMLLIIWLGRKFVTGALVKSTKVVQKVFGVIIIVVALAISQGWDLKLLQKLNYGSGITKFIEQNEVVNKKLDELSGREEIVAGECKEAPGFDGGGEWLNSPPLALEELRGKVVLVKFWTYTCINCIRTFPFVNAWEEKYADDGLVIVGVHTPEFEFEKDLGNLRQAVADNEIRYPVVQDNDYKIWRAYANRYWPAKYLIDKNGCIVNEHFGEGKYEETEELIQELLGVEGATFDMDAEKGVSGRTPERYLGYGRTEDFVSPEGVIKGKVAMYSFPKEIGLDEHAFMGNWLIGEEYARAAAGAKLNFNFKAKEVFLVMRAEKGAKVQVGLDGDVSGAGLAQEVGPDGLLEVSKDRLYKLVKLEDLDEHMLDVEVVEGEVEMFAFTFG